MEQIADSPRRQALRKYFYEVTRDLVRRGSIKRANGESIDRIMASEFVVVVKEMQNDLVAIAIEVGYGAAQNGFRLLEGVFHDALSGLFSSKR